MSRSVSIREVQNAISDLRAWMYYSAPDWGRPLIGASCDLLERILCNRDALTRQEGEGT